MTNQNQRHAEDLQETTLETIFGRAPRIKGLPINGGVSNGGVSRSGLVLPFLSLFGLSRFFWDFPDLRRDGPGIFPICPLPLSQPINIKSTYEEQSRKGPRHNLDLSRKKWETPGFGNPFRFQNFPRFRAADFFRTPSFSCGHFGPGKKKV